MKEKAHKNVQYCLKCPQELTVALLGFDQFVCQYSWLLGVHEIGTILVASNVLEIRVRCSLSF